MRGARGLADNDLVRVFNERGEVHCELSVSPIVLAGDGEPAARPLAQESTERVHRDRALSPILLTDLGGGRVFPTTREWRWRHSAIGVTA